MRSFLLVAVLVACWAKQSCAQIIQVSADRNSIQAGIDAADDGDTVLIAEGRYFENINFLGKAITVASHYLIDGDTTHISRTIIDGSRSSRFDTASVVTLWTGEDTTSILCGLTITGGKGTLVKNIHGNKIEGLSPETCYLAGGGILIHNAGGKIVHNRVISNHLNTVSDERGSNGAGILAAINHHRTAVIRNNIIRDNSAQGNGAWGGGISLWGGRIIVEQNYILGNHIQADGIIAGGGILWEDEGIEGTIEEVTIRNNVVSGNTAYSTHDIAGGGGIAIAFGFDSTEVHIYNNIIAFNTVQGIGGGLYFVKANARVANNLIFKNMAGLYGGSIGTELDNNLDTQHNLIWECDNWIATPDGLHPLKVSEAEIFGFDPPEGISIRPQEHLFSIDPASGAFHFGARKEMFAFNPQLLDPLFFLNTQVILEFKSYSESEHPPLQLNFLLGDNKMSYRIAPFDSTMQYDSQFKLHLEGKRDTLLLLKGAVVNHLSRLRAGNHTLWVAPVDEHGITGSQEITFRIHVQAPWYRTSWFIGSCVLFLALFVTGMIRLKTARLRREKQKLELEVAKRTRELILKNEQILEMEHMKTRFFTDVSHEIRTPLSLISGPLDRLLEKEGRDPESDGFLWMIKRNSKRLLQLVNQLLDISRLDSGYMKLVLEEGDAIGHLRMLVNEFLSLAETRQITYKIDIPDVSIKNWYDREKTEKVCANLLSNAFKFTPEFGTITCRIKILSRSKDSADPLLRIIVADTGHGISLKEREKIFERFYRSDRDVYEASGGTGIGLSLTRDLIDLMHGDIVVKSREGSGSVFLVSIPLGKDHLAESEYTLRADDTYGTEEFFPELKADTKLPGQVQSVKKAEILIVEDNADLRTFISQGLSAVYQVREARDGLEGHRMALSSIPDLIISDVMMPGMDGMELCNKLKHDERTSHIPVIMLTARSTGEDKLEGLMQGADDYIFKPFHMKELTVRIHNLLEQRERLRKKYSNMVGMHWRDLSVTTLDEKFLRKAMEIISENLQNFDFNVNAFQKEMFMSREHMYRKMKALTGKSPSDLIRDIRLRTAASMLKNNGDNVSEVSLKVGFSNQSYFAKCFKQHYGKTPRQYKLQNTGGSGHFA